MRLTKISRVGRLRLAGIVSAFATSASIGFALPLLMLLAWERFLFKTVSLDVITVVWLALIVLSVALLASKSSKVSKLRSFAAGSLLGCGAFFVGALCLASLD